MKSKLLSAGGQAGAIRDRFDDAYQPEPNSGCWIWLRGANGAGYGTFHLANRKSVLAHRFAYERARGPITGGLQILHRCDNPICVNPDHLKAGTAQDNLRDMALKGRTAGQKLSAKDAVAIKSDRRSLKAIAADYRVSIFLVSKIRHQKTWRAV
jgi:hypothetical protein